MAQKTLRHHQSELGERRQRLFLEIEDEVSDIATNGKVRKPRSQKRSKACRVETIDALAVAHILQEELGELRTRLAAIESLLQEVHEQTVNGSIVREYYSTQEVAKLLSKRPYTVREWCRLGRVHGEKSHSGRGLEEEWRISHEELKRIQNEGLLPLQTLTEIRQPRRMNSR